MTFDDVHFSVRHPSGLQISAAQSEIFGFRKADATYQTSAGSFLIEEKTSGDFEVATKLSGDTLSSASGDALATLSISTRGDNLVITARASDPQNNRAFMAFACDDPSAGGFLGFGAQTFDADHRGQIVPIWVSEQGIGKVDSDVPSPVWNLVGTRHQSYISVPTMLAPRAGASFGLHATTFARSIWDLCKSDPTRLRIEAWEGTIELIISPGPTPLDVIQQQTSFNGRAPLGPEWTFGVWMERIGGTQAVDDEAALLRREHIPASAIWSEDWRGGAKEGANDYVLEEDWRWDQALYPGLPDMIDRLHAQGMKFMTYANTFIDSSADVWDEAVAGDHLVKDRRGQAYSFAAPSGGTSGLAELFRPETRSFVQQELEATLALGSDGWMADFGEWYPADPRDVKTADGSDAASAHHRYPVAWAEVNRDAIAASGRSDVVVFLRSGYSGSQGAARVIWAGDQRTSFEPTDGLPTIIPIIIGLGATGFPIVTHDIGGYVSATNPPADKELFFRWTELGALNPVMRTHHGRSAYANWRWSSDQETIAHFKRWADLHTRLFPVWYGLAAFAAATGAPILRSPALHYPEQTSLHGVKDAYLIGDFLYVAPVVTASTASRTVVLPPGLWYSWSDGQAIQGGASVTADAPLGELPMYARAGAIIPMLPPGVESLLTDLDGVRFQREVIVYLGAKGAFTEAGGGEYVLMSDVHPPGSGTMSIEASGDATTCPFEQVCIETRHFDPKYRFSFDFRW